MPKVRDAEEKSDEELVKLILTKDQEYFAYLINRYQSRLLGYIKRLTNVNHEDAEDLLQEIFIKVYKNLNSFNLDQKFSTWLYRITHNEVISNHRRLQSKSRDLEIKVDEEIFNNQSSPLDLNKEIDASLNQERIYWLVNQLEKKYKEVLILRYFEDRDYQDISFIIKKPLGTVGTLLSRAKVQLKQKLQEANLKIYDAR